MTLDTVIHIGFPKTGTTTLQKHLFSRHSQVHYLGKPYASEEITGHILNLVMEESLTYDGSFLGAYLEGEIEKGIRGGKKVLVFSDELLVSASKTRDKGVVAARLKELFQGGKIIVTLRNQYEMLKSAYINGGRLLKNVPSRYKGRAIGFDEWLEMSFERPGRSYIGNIRYIDTLDYYVGLFGRENVCVLLFEEFLARKEDYIKKLGDFMGIDTGEALQWLGEKHENKRLLQSQVDFELMSTRLGVGGNRRVLSGVLRRLYFLGKKGKKDGTAAVSIPVAWKEKIHDYYKEGNGEIIKRYGLPLAESGYPV